jgi:hypothetical protein
MTRFLVIKKLSRLDESVKKRTRHKTKPKQKKSKKMQNPSSLNLFTFIVLSPIDVVDVGVVVIIILLLCSIKWLLLYVSPCRENLKSKFTINPPNGTVTRLPTRFPHTKMELEPFFPIS